MRVRRLLYVAACLLFCALLVVNVARCDAWDDEDIDGWGDEDFGGDDLIGVGDDDANIDVLDTELPDMGDELEEAVAAAELAGTAPAEKPSTPVADTPKTPMSVGFHWHERDWTYEAVGVVCVVLFIINYFRGRWANDAIITSWFTACVPNFFAQQFFKIGAFEGVSSQGSLFKTADHEYQMYASGRINCEGALVTVTLEKRQDLWFKIAKALAVHHSYDSVLIEIPFAEDVRMAPLSLCIGETTKVQEYAKTQMDLKKWGREFKLPAALRSPRDLAKSARLQKMASEFTCLGNVSGAAEGVFDADLCALVTQITPFLEYAHISSYYLPTDEFAEIRFPGRKRMLVLKLRLRGRKTDIRACQEGKVALVNAEKNKQSNDGVLSGDARMAALLGARLAMVLVDRAVAYRMPAKDQERVLGLHQAFEAEQQQKLREAEKKEAPEEEETAVQRAQREKREKRKMNKKMRPKMKGIR